MPREIRVYETDGGKTPFTDWMESLEGQKIHGVILNRIDRVESGNLGDCHAVGEGVLEFRLDVGPGYRVFFGQDGDLIILLTGGTKKTQSRDIKTAKKFWRNYNG